MDHQGRLLGNSNSGFFVGWLIGDGGGGGGGGDSYIVPQDEKEARGVFRYTDEVGWSPPEENINILPYLVKYGMLYYFASSVGSSQSHYSTL